MKVCSIADVCKCVCACVRAASQAMSESRIATTREGKNMTTVLVLYIRRPGRMHIARISRRLPADELMNHRRIFLEQASFVREKYGIPTLHWRGESCDSQVGLWRSGPRKAGVCVCLSVSVHA